MKTRGKGKKQNITCPERLAFLGQRHGAKKRGIEFHFTYEEWLSWWQKHLGPNWFALRGRGSGQYVMARNGDTGPYATQNVRCIIMEQNLKEILTNNKDRGNAKLTEGDVKAIYLTLKTNVPRGAMLLAAKYQMGESAINDIKFKRTWRHITDLLD